MTSNVAKTGSATRGELSFLWAQDHMGIIQKIREKNIDRKPLRGYRLGFCLHITKETSVLLMAARDLGAEIAACSANPLSTQDDIASFLSRQGLSIYAWRGQNDKEYKDCLKKVLRFNPHIVTDDGAELHVSACNLRWEGIIGGTEETTTGISRLRVLQEKKTLLYPVVGVNDALTKYLFDNRYGTGQSTIDGLMRATGIFIAGKNVVVCGYGWVGKGVASKAKGMGGIVTITEIDSIRALEAHMDGYAVKRLADIADTGDIFITCTGQTKVIRKEHIKKMKSGAILANAGHFDVEIDINCLYELDSSPAPVRPTVDKFCLGEKKIYLIGKGRVINLVSGEGHPSEVMSLSFANQLLSILFVARFHGRLKNRLYKVPRRIDRKVARYGVEAMKITLDRLTGAQKAYKRSF
ncbi:MAG: adenosylhomocysteinase [Nitrososphaeraceae archaeon]|nr:adenosylhomocysteinase [Nitrososphaeraceae archaeon]